MGLDMYLDARQNMVLNGISCQAMYWRKKNHIHKWFVDNVQGGVDDCGTYNVSYEDIESLLNTIDEVLTDHSKAEEWLPPQSGFFFGSTDIDEYYFDSLKETKEELSKLLDSFRREDGTYDGNWSFEYTSSW